MITEMFGHGYDPDYICHYLNWFFPEDSKKLGLTQKAIEEIIIEAFCPGMPNADWHTARVKLSTATYNSDEALGVILERLELDISEEDGNYYMTYIAVPRRGDSEPVYASQRISKEEYEILNERF